MQLPETLTTERLTIRKFRAEDKPRFIEFMTDKESTKYLEFSATQKTPEGASHLLDFILNSYETDEPVFSMAIEDKEHGYIGFCGISKIDDTAWECYYSLNRKYWGKGFASEAMLEVIDWCRKNSVIKELRAYLHPENKESEQVAIGLGMENREIQMHPVFEHKRKLYAMEVSS
jgi:ribosomal-protein-alanine N-acetyltransferase